MSLQAFLTSDRLKQHTTSALELRNLRAVVKREVQDADVIGLSTDRKYACSYNAALQLAHMAIACAGYRTNPNKPGHHRTTFEVVEIILGSPAAPLTAYFDICRQKRNKVDYDSAQLVTETEMNEIRSKVTEFEQLIEDWITRTYPQFTMNTQP